MRRLYPHNLPIDVCKKSIAVVGSAESLWSHQYGELIDSHFYVLRFNIGGIKTPTVQEGSKTSICFINGPLNKGGKEFYRKVAIANRNHPDAYNTWIHTYEADEDKKHRWSSGMIVLENLNRLKARKVSLFGFDFKKTGSHHDGNIRKIPHDWEWEENRSIQLVEKNGWNFMR